MELEKQVSIPKYYTGESIFITGGTGLIGKALVEKILRSCPDVANIYVLIRPRKGMSIEERWSKVTNLPLFDRLKSEQPEALKKVVLVPGDIEQQGLGLPSDFLQIIKENVTHVYHIAAMVQFTDSLTDAVARNVRGTLAVLELAKIIAKLKVFTYLSTAYSHVNNPPEETEEKLLPACQNWRDILKLAETHPTQLQALREKILCGHPNPYTWSKSLAEQAANSYRKYFPIIIIRPSIVLTTFEDPIPGWADAVSGYTSMALGKVYGAIHVLAANKEKGVDFVPLDFTVKACIIAPWRLHLTNKNLSPEEQQNQDVEFYNACMSKQLFLTNADVQDYGEELLKDIPSENQIWVSSDRCVGRSKFLKIYIFVHLFLPAVLADGVLLLLKKQTKAVRLTIKLLNGFRLAEKLMNENIVFPNEKFFELAQNLKREDKPAFEYSLNGIEKREVVRKEFLGLRKYYLKEDMSEEAIERNRKRVARLKIIHKTLTTLIYSMITIFLLNYYRGPIMSLAQWA